MVEKVKIDFKIRSFTNNDAVFLSEALNTDTIARDTTIDLPWDVNKASWWISFINESSKQQPIREKHFAIEVEGKLAGGVGIINVDGHKCELGYWVKDEYSGRGIMTEAIRKTVKYGVKDMGIKRFFAPVLLHNKASERVLEKNGFELEGRLRKFYFKNGKYTDALCYALVK